MTFKSLIAAGAVALSLAGVSATQAKADVDFGIVVGTPGLVFGGGSYGGHGHGFVGVGVGGFGSYSGISCSKGRKIVRWNGFHHVNTVECNGDTYTYKAKRDGDKWRVRVDRWSGEIISVSLI